MASNVEQRVAAVRRFNRIYTRRIGLLGEGYLDSPFGLTEVRVLYELAHRPGLTAAELSRELALDPGYLSRVLRGFERRGLLQKRPAPDDGRQKLLALTGQGWEIFAPLEDQSRREIGALLASLDEPSQRRLVAAMTEIERLLGGAQDPAPAYRLRPPRPGDYGWVVSRHGALYAEEYGWDETFEALVAEIVAAFVRSFDPAFEACWIAEKDGENVGSVFLVKHPERDGVAKLRLLLVEPSARGLGIGGRLVEECIRTARRLDYRTLSLWTNDVLISARRIYEAAGFRLVAEAPHRAFGHDLVEQTWELAL